VLLGAWAVGFATVVILWLVRWARIRPLLRQATPVALTAPMPVLATPTIMEPGLVGVWRPVLLVPGTLFEHLGRPGIDALMAHEAYHFRRKDNLTAAIHMLVEALFWFHPMVWWIGGRLVDERERACDEAVVRSGHDREVYAASLLECCRLFLQSPLRCIAGASGSNLSRRVEMIMTSPLRSSLSRTGKAMLIAAGACALASPVAAGWLSSPAERQAVSRALALASSPARALADDAPAAASTPSKSDVATPVTPAKTGAPPDPLVQHIATLRLEPVQLDPVVEDQLQPSLAKPLPLATRAEIPDAQMALIANTQMPEPSGRLGPGHYVERSGLKTSGDCDVIPGGSSDAGYRLSTRPIAPGHVITNFHYELVGASQCKTKWPSDEPSASCQIVTDRPDKKTVEFRLFPNRNYCFRTEVPSLAMSKPGAVTRSEMVLSYDVQ
jgi:hypothetical protein